MYSPEGVVEKRGKVRVIHDLTFGREPWRSVNAGTDLEQVAGCKLGGVVDAISKRI